MDFKLYIINRILDSSSKLKALKNKYPFLITNCKVDKEIYKSLDILLKYSNQIQARINAKIKISSIGRVTNLTYYDVTNYYFETMYGDEDIYEIDENSDKYEEVNGIIVPKNVELSEYCKKLTK